MNHAAIEQRIVSRSDILLGKPVIRGTRIPVYLIEDLVAAGLTPEQIVDDYPDLTVLDVQAAIAYGAAHHAPAESTARSV